MSLSVRQAVEQRKSCRAFLPKLPSAPEVVELVRLASRAPSGANMLPWKVYVLAGEERQRLVDAVAARFDAGVHATVPHACWSEVD